MKEYEYIIVLNKKVNVSNKVTSISVLIVKTIQLINGVYEKGFTIFGCGMIH